MEERDSLILKIKICMRITIIFAIVMVVSFLLEILVIQVFGTADWAQNVAKLLGFLALASPFGIMIPLFFRVNFQSKLLMLDRQHGSGTKEKEREER